MFIFFCYLHYQLLYGAKGLNVFFNYGDSMQVSIITPWSSCATVPHTNPITDKYDGEWHQTLVPLEYGINNATVTIPAGFITNFGSVPKWARWLIDVGDESLMGFILHDWLYSNHYARSSELRFILQLSQRQCDDILLQMCALNGQDGIERYLTYLGVRIGGRREFRKSYAIVGIIRKALLLRLQDTIDSHLITAL